MSRLHTDKNIHEKIERLPRQGQSYSHLGKTELRGYNHKHDIMISSLFRDFHLFGSGSPFLQETNTAAIGTACIDTHLQP